MQNEIPAGSKVKVAITEKGVTTMRDAEVLAHMDGLVHVNLDGQAVSVDPSQIVMDDAPAEGTQENAAPAETGSGNAQVAADLIANLTARVTDLEVRLTALEARMPAEGGVVNPPAPPADPAQPADPAPATQEPLNDESTAAAESGEPAAGN